MSVMITRPMRTLYGGICNSIEYACNETSLHAQTRLREAKAYLDHSMQSRDKITKRLRGDEKPVRNSKSNTSSKQRVTKRRRDIVKDAAAGRLYQLMLAEETRSQHAKDLADHYRQAADNRMRTAFQKKAELWEQKVRHVQAQAEHRGDYMDDVRREYPPSNCPQKRFEQTQTAMASILGPNRMQAGVGLPSGHYGIEEDPVLSQHQKQCRIKEVFDQFHDWKNSRQAEDAEQLRRILQLDHERQRKRQQINDTLNAYAILYEQRVQKLLSFGGVLHKIVDGLEKCLIEGDFQAFMQGVTVLINDVLEPAYRILKEMQQEIMLEWTGADRVAAAWPLERLDMMLRVLERHGNELPRFFHHQVRYMMNGVKAVCMPIINAKPFVHPLERTIAAPLSSQWQARPIDFASFLEAKAQPQQQPQQRNQQQTQPKQAPKTSCYQQTPLAVPVVSISQTASSQVGSNGSKNFSGFAALAAATRAQREVNQPQVIRSDATPPISNANPFNNLQIVQQHPFVKNTNQRALVISSTSRADKRSFLWKFIDESVLDFADNVDNLIKDRSISKRRREEIVKWLRKIVYFMGTEYGLLTKKEHGTFHGSLDHLLDTIDRLSEGKMKKHELTKEMVALAKKCKKLWPQ